MIDSIARYSRYLTGIILEGKGHYLVRDLSLRRTLSSTQDPPDLKASADALATGINWLLRAQQIGIDGGMASFHLVDGWSGSYPETTGYIIPTLLDYARIHDEPLAQHAAMRAAAFLLDIRLPRGGWQGGRIGEDRPAVVFNTGQVVRGMLAAYRKTADPRFLAAAVSGCEWLCEVQHPEGFWKKNALMEQPRVYDAYVDVPLLMTASEAGREDFREAAIRNLNWIIAKKTLPNGWFKDCDNTVRHNLRPILHTIAYTLDGLLDAAALTGQQDYSMAAHAGAEILKDQFLRDGKLRGRYDARWKGSESFICTGGAQMAIVWMKIFRDSGRQEYLEAAKRIIGQLIRIQGRQQDAPDTRGALQGSFPIWGRYEPFAFPNWATKFLCDALMMLEETER